MDTLVSIARSKLAMFQNDYDNHILDEVQEIQQSNGHCPTRRKSVPLKPRATPSQSRSSSQTRTRLQSGTRSASCYDVTLEPSQSTIRSQSRTSSARIDKLEPGIRRYYKELMALIDFTKVNNPIERLDNAPQICEVDLNLDSIVSRFRADIDNDVDQEARAATENADELDLS